MEGRIVFRGEETVGDPDPDTGRPPRTPGAVQYDGPFKIQSFQPYETKPEMGGHTTAVQRYRIDIPVGSQRVREGAMGIVMESESDPSNVGRRFRAAAPFGKTYASAQRLPVDEIVG